MADVVGRHEDHDPAQIAALLDRELDPAERASAEAIVAGCPSCAALYDDLRSLARAARALPTVPRTRDFRLTAADAARLAGAAGEPVATTSRLTNEMTDPRTTAAHATHDPILVAALTDRSLTRHRASGGRGPGRRLQPVRPVARRSRRPRGGGPGDADPRQAASTTS